MSSTRSAPSGTEARRPRPSCSQAATVARCCHRRALELAAELGCASVAFPAISTGVYDYPVELAAPVAVAAVREALHSPVELVRFVLFGDESLAAFTRALGEG